MSSTYAKHIEYDRETRDFACYLNGELVSFARTYQEGEAVLDELVHELLTGAEAGDYAVYCEACGAVVDPALAVLDGELMVCPGCAPCSAAEFEAMQMAEAERLMAAEMDALVPDPETWAYVSAVPCEPVTPADLNYYGNSTGGFDGGADIDPDEGDDEPVACNVCGSDGGPCVECNPAEHPYLMTGSPCAPEHRCDLSRDLSRRVIFDALCQAADELRDYWRDVPRRVEAINVAWEWVMLQPVYHFNANGDLLVPSGSKAGVVYAVGHTCPCTAGRWGNHCKHATVADLIGRAVRIARLKAA